MSLVIEPSDAVSSERRAPRVLGLLGVLRAEMLRGTGPLAGAAVAAVICVAMAGHADEWLRHWTDATDMLRVSALLVGGPLTAAAGCWQGGRERRRGTRELRASLPRAPLTRTLAAAAPAVLWPVAGYLVAALGTLVATWPYASGGRPFWLLMAADATALASLGAVGFVVGGLARWRLAAPVLAAATYVGLGAPTYLTGNARWLDPANEHRYWYDAPVWWFGPASALWTAGLAAAVLLAYAARNRVLALLPLVVALAAAVPVARAGDGVWQPDPAARRPVCAGEQPRVCLSAMDQRLLPAVSAALSGPDAELHGLRGAPVRWVGGPVRVRPGDARLPDPQPGWAPGRLVDPVEYAHEVVSTFLMDRCGASDAAHETSDDSGKRADDVDTAVAQWLAPGRDFGVSRFPEVGPKRYIARLRAMDKRRSHAFLARYLADDRCDVKRVPVP